MKKITILFLFLLCAYGYSQNNTKLSETNSPAVLQQQQKQTAQTKDAQKETINPIGVMSTGNGISNPQRLNKRTFTPLMYSNIQTKTAASYGDNNPVSYKTNTTVVSSNLFFESDIQEEILAHQLAMANQPVNYNVSPQGYGNRNPLSDIIPAAGATETFNPAVGDHFFDPGGPGGSSTGGTPGNYPNCGCDTQTTLTGVSEINFQFFSVFATFDYLRIYDGTDASGVKLYDNGTGGANSGDITLADMIASNGSSTFNSASGNFFFFFHSSTVVDYGGWDAEIISASGGGGGSTCSEENPNDFTFVDGINCSSATPFKTANDLTVAADQNFTLTNITASIFANGGIANVAVNYYSDAAGLPGALIGSQASAIIDNQTVIGSNFGLNVNEVELSVTPFLFAGQAGTATTYWVELSVTDGSGSGTVYWIVTTSSAIGNPTALFDGASWAYNNPAYDGVYIWEGNCEPIGGGGGSTCSQDNPENAFENGYTTSTDQAQRIAFDVTVPADTDFTLNTATVNIWTNPGSTIVSSDVVFYNDAAGTPGAVMATQTAIVPTSQTVIGSNFGYNISEVVFNIAPELLAGQAGSPKTYWMTFAVTISAGSGFIGSTTASIEGYEAYFSADAGVTWNVIAGNDIVYNLEGDCAPIGGGGSGCTAGVYTDRASFNTEAGPINLEDFAGGPGALSQCGLVISSTGESCFPAGEILPGIEITSNNSAGGQTVYVDPADGFGNTIPIVGSNTFVDYTIINFPDNNVNSFGFDLITLLGTGPVEVRIFGAGGLIDTQIATGTNPESFWGYIASETVVRVELQDLTGANIEGIGMLAFGECSGGSGGTCISTAYDSIAVPFDIDGAGTTTVDCANAPNLIPVTVADAGTIGSGATLENITIDIAHTWSSDLDLYLVSPSGTELLLANDLGGSTANGYNGTMFEDGGADITLATAPFGVGPYEPMGGDFATAFAGEDITGDWSLKVCDDSSGDTGQVLQFSMSICVPEVITNDDCSNAYAVACGDSITGETLTATDSGGNAAPDVFYKFTGTGSPQLVTISLCAATDFDTVLRIFADCSLANQIAVNDDSCGLQSEVSFTSDGTSTYIIMVEGFGSNAGNFSLDVTCTQPLINDECSGAIAVSCGDSVAGSTIGATVDDTTPACGPGITSPGVWYSLNDNSGLPGNITLSLCNGTDFDSKISVYSGTCSALVCVDGNDDACGLQSEITFASNGNTQYYILIHSFGGATGNFTMDVTCTPTPPPNDMIVNSIDVDEIGFPYTDPAVAMPAATTENGNPAGCDLTGANGVWYNFVAGGDGTANAMIVTPGGASSVTFYTAPNENAVETDLTLVVQQTNQCAPGTSASIFTLAGQAYYVFVLNTGAITDIVIDGTNLGVSDNTIAGFSYYPNPTNGILNLKSVDNIDKVSLYNILGQLVIDNRVNATTSQVDMSGLSTGTYLMRVSVNGEIGTYRVLKQ